MKNSINKKTRKLTIIMGGVASLAFAVLIIAVLLYVRQYLIASSGGLGDLASEDARQMLTAQAEAELMHLAETKMRLSEAHFGSIAEDVTRMAAAATSILADTRYTENEALEFLREYMLESMVHNNRGLSAAYYGTEQGEFFFVDAQGGVPSNRDMRSRPWYIAAKEAGELIWTRIYPDQEGRGQAITCAMPYYAPDGSLAGVAGIGNFIDSINELITGEVGESGQSFIIDQNGDIIIAKDLQYDGDGDPFLEGLTEDLDDALHAVAGHASAGRPGIERIMVQGVDKLMAYYGFEKMPWTVVVIIDTDEVIEPALRLEDSILDLTQSNLTALDNRIIFIIAITAAMIAVATAGLMLFYGRLATNITDPIRKLTEDAAIVGAGNLDYALHVDTGDELEQLADSFNSMISNIKTITAEKERAAEKVQKTEEEKRYIEEARRQLETILEILPIAIVIMRKEDGTLLYANKTALQIYAAESFERDGVGKNVFDFAPEIQPDGRSSMEVIAEAFSKDEGVAEMQSRRLNGELFRTRTSFCGIYYNGMAASLNAIEDITAEHAHQQRLKDIASKEQEANQLKSRFLANMSHEVRTPMNAILGIAEIQLSSDSLPPETADALAQIYEAGNLLLNIINDILDLSKIEAGKLEIIPVDYDLPSLISDIVQLIRVRFDSKPITFNLDVDADTPLNMFGDELRLKQILSNVLSNAFKYTDKGEIRLSVHAEPPGGSEAGNRHDRQPADADVALVFTVSDTGQGMTEEQLGMLFDDFARFNLHHNRTIIGTGLGMSITKRLVDLMGGEISVESEVDKGSVFTVRVPQRRINGLVCGSDMSDKLRDFNFFRASIAKTSRTLREYMPYGSVLIVDDVESNIYVTRGMLLPYGLQIDTAGSGLTAIEKIKAGNVYDIVFMDHMMPRMDGIEATKTLRGMGYKNYIIALTANALVGSAEVFLESGFDGYISKPIDSRELNAILNEFIRNKKPPEVVKAARREQAERLSKREHETEGGAGPRHGEAGISKMEQFFMLDAESAIGELEEIGIHAGRAGNDGAGPDGDGAEDVTDAQLDSYEIAVHGIKSALNNIGEHELSSYAFRLEQAVRDRDLPFVTEETPAFIDELKTLLDKLRKKEAESGPRF